MKLSWALLVIPSCVGAPPDRPPVLPPHPIARYHPLTELVMPDKFSASYKIDEAGDYDGFNLGLTWDLEWGSWAKERHDLWD